MTTLENSYCVPRTVEEWDIFGLTPLTGHKVMWLGGEPTLVSGTFNDRTEIPVPRFLDLMHDRIVPWKLEEIGFQSPVLAKWKYELTLKHVWGEEPFKKPSLRRIRFDKGEMSLDNQPINISKFTDLLSLIRFLTPPPEET